MQSDMAYDVIGDVHGCSRTLHALLDRLGYREERGVWRCGKGADKQDVFVGDFIDRGPGQREVLATVRAMIDAGSAQAVMANHEFNALGFATPRRDGNGWLRARSDKNIAQHIAFLAAFTPGSADHRDALDWFRTLPLWLDLGGLRVIHACWDQRALDHLAPQLADGDRLTEDLLHDASTKGTKAYEAVETILKGPEVTLPHGLTFRDKSGIERREIRTRWWDASANTYQEVYMGPEEARASIPDEPLESDHVVPYGDDEPPCFVGHYWMTGTPAPLTPNVACADYSVPKPRGQLVAYRWDGELEIDPAKFVGVPTRDA